MNWIDEVKWDARGAGAGRLRKRSAANDVLMFAFMNREALALTAERSARPSTGAGRATAPVAQGRRESGNVQKVREMRIDCDADVVLLKVEQTGHAPGEPGIACHTGRHSCFYQRYEGGAWHAVEPVLKDPERIYK